MTTTAQAAHAEVPRWGWQERAACRDEDLELFFGPEGETRAQRTGREARAIAVCAGCPVREACLRHALSVPERHGIWGGRTEQDRLELRRAAQRRAA